MDPTIKSQSGCYLELSESDCYLLGEGTIERRENDTIHLIFQGISLNRILNIKINVCAKQFNQENYRMSIILIFTFIILDAK